MYSGNEVSDNAYLNFQCVAFISLRNVSHPSARGRNLKCLAIEDDRLLALFVCECHSLSIIPE